MITFTRRELVRAWKNAQTASKANSRNNAHRLLLFYATECGLKAAYLKRQGLDVIEAEIGRRFQHNLNEIMSDLKVGGDYLLPTNLNLASIKKRDGTQLPRPCDIGTFNQVWRYGGEFTSDDDGRVEKMLEKINVWIAKEIR